MEALKLQTLGLLNPRVEQEFLFMKAPIPVFDNLKHINAYDIAARLSDQTYVNDYVHALNFLKAYNGSQGTFIAYRREIERLLHWCTLVAKKPLKDLKRQDIEDFIHFCQKPPKPWIGFYKTPRFIGEHGSRTPNPKWRPFIVTISKAAYRLGERPDPKNFELSQSAIKDMFAILGLVTYPEKSVVR